MRAIRIEADGSAFVEHGAQRSIAAHLLTEGVAVDHSLAEVFRSHASVEQRTTMHRGANRGVLLGLFDGAGLEQILCEAWFYTAAGPH